MLLFDGRGVAYSYESTVPAPLLPSIDQSYNPPRSYKAPPMADARSVRVSTHWTGPSQVAMSKRHVQSFAIISRRILAARVELVFSFGQYDVILTRKVLK